MQSKTISAKTHTSRNEGRGFHGVMEAEYGTRNADDYFAYTVSFLEGKLKVPTEEAIDYLDSRRGRHFGDRVADIAAQRKMSVYEAVGAAANERRDADWHRDLREVPAHKNT